MKRIIVCVLMVCLMLSGAFAETAVYTATENDQSAVDVNGTQSLTITDALIQKTAGEASSADASSFRGVNAAVRVYDQATLTLSHSVIEASASNATGVFAYDGGTVELSDCTVTVTGGGAGGIQVAGGGTLTGNNLTVTSASKAAIRSDWGRRHHGARRWYIHFHRNEWLSCHLQYGEYLCQQCGLRIGTFTCGHH